MPVNATEYRTLRVYLSPVDQRGGLELTLTWRVQSPATWPLARPAAPPLACDVFPHRRGRPWQSSARWPSLRSRPRGSAWPSPELNKVVRRNKNTYKAEAASSRLETRLSNGLNFYHLLK